MTVSGYFPTKRDPLRGATEMAEPSVFGQDAIGLMRFELIEEGGGLLALAAAGRTGSGVDDGRIFAARACARAAVSISHHGPGFRRQALARCEA
jgi:hypothetical protein